MHGDSLARFRHIRRMRDSRFELEIAAIMPGQYFVSEEPMIVYTVLGSCVSVCVRDPIVGVGGMNHFMLPAPPSGVKDDSWGISARYGSYAMEILLNEIMKRGGKKKHFEVKVFGGGKLYEGATDVGTDNAEWAMSYVRREGLNLISADVGGSFPRKLYYFTDSGRVLMKTLQRTTTTILERESEYRDFLRQRNDEGDVTLF